MFVSGLCHFDVNLLRAMYIQDGSIQQRLTGDAAALGNVSSYAASEIGDHMASAHTAQSMVNYQLPTEQVTSAWTSLQPAVTTYQMASG